MRWFLLRDRRHEGPYTKEQIAEGVKAGRIDPRDYLLPEKAVEDQSSFAYISAGDVLGPEFIYDLKKTTSSSPQSTNQGTSTESQGSVSSPSKTQLISEFEEGLESTQLINLRKEKAAAESTSTSTYRLESFASQPSPSFKFPWAIAAVVLVVVAVASYFAQPLLAPASKAPIASASNSQKSSPVSAYRNLKQNRVPTGRVQLPSTGTRDEEPASVTNGIRAEERAEPVRKRRKRKPVEGERKDAAEESDTASDAESFDEEDYVEEDESSEEDVDEADI